MSIQDDIVFNELTENLINSPKMEWNKVAINGGIEFASIVTAIKIVPKMWKKNHVAGAVALGIFGLACVQSLTVRTMSVASYLQNKE